MTYISLYILVVRSGPGIRAMKKKGVIEGQKSALGNTVNFVIYAVIIIIYANYVSSCEGA